MSESNDSDIRLYFRDKLCPFASANIVWPSENTLDILMVIAAGVIAQGCGQTLGLGLVNRNRTVVYY